jgi:hypothetical protein
MSNTQLQDFLDVLDVESKKQLKVTISSKKEITVSPLSFKQQKSLITTGMDGMAGVMLFIKNLNDIIIFNSSNDELKIYDRVPIVLALRKELSSKNIKVDDVEINVDDLLSQFKKFDLDEKVNIDGGDYIINLKVPTLKQENKVLSICIEELKKLDIDNIGKNISLILSYEIPKFVESISFNDKLIKFEDLSISEKTKILDNLPANITNKITDYILKIREYDEALLTINGITVDIDSAFFE